MECASCFQVFCTPWRGIYALLFLCCKTENLHWCLKCSLPIQVSKVMDHTFGYLPSQLWSDCLIFTWSLSGGSPNLLANISISAFTHLKLILPLLQWPWMPYCSLKQRRPWTRHGQYLASSPQHSALSALPDTSPPKPVRCWFSFRKGLRKSHAF